MITTIICIVIAYLIGSLSSAIIVCKLFNLPDPRTQGSMNPGTTNVLRIGGKTAASLTLTGDLLKGFIPVFVSYLLGVSGFFLGLVALAALLGHIYPIFFKFQGGKGVATAAGAILALSPFSGFVAIIIWIVVAIIFHYSSLAALVAAVIVPTLIALIGDKYYLLPMLAIVAILIWRHKDNIEQLRNGTEGKINLQIPLPSFLRKKDSDS